MEKMQDEDLKTSAKDAQKQISPVTPTPKSPVTISLVTTPTKKGR